MKALLPLVLFYLTLVLSPGRLVAQTDTWDCSVPNIAYLFRTTPTPWRIHVAVVDLKNPGVEVKTLLSNGVLYGRETTSGMAARGGVRVAVNGDFCSTDATSYVHGVPQGITVVDGEIHTAPKYRTAIGFTREMTALVQMWTDRWNWYGRVRDSDGNDHEIVMMNLDVNNDWLCMFTDLYGRATPGSALGSGVAEAVVGADSIVTEVRSNQPGVAVPSGGYVLTGRGAAATWITTFVTVGERLTVEYTTKPDWRNLWQAVSGGPRFVKDGAYYADPKVAFPGGEEFATSYKTSYYDVRQPRSAAGITINGDTLVLAVVDGRQTSSAGMTLQELADLMKEFGVTDATQFDSGGSATFFFRGSTRNSPSDGTERAVANALGVASTQRYLNVAPRAVITSVSGELSGSEAAKLIDGQRSRGSGKWVALGTGPHWIELDLGETYAVTHYRLFHAQYAGDPAYLNTREFTISSRADTADPWGEDFAVQNDTTWQPQDNLLTLSSPKRLRYVRLEISKATYVDYENNLRQPEFSIYIADTVVSSIPSSLPSRYCLYQNYPNPFNATTVVEYETPAEGTVQLRVYDNLGREVARLVDQVQPAGYHTARFDGSGLASGVYTAQLEAGRERVTRRMLLIK